MGRMEPKATRSADRQRDMGPVKPRDPVKLRPDGTRSWNKVPNLGTSCTALAWPNHHFLNTPTGTLPTRNRSQVKTPIMVPTFRFQFARP